MIAYNRLVYSVALGGRKIHTEMYDNFMVIVVTETSSHIFTAYLRTS